MRPGILDKWESGLREDALADDFAIFRDHLRRLDLPDRPDLMLEGTICLVRMCFGYSVLDGCGKEFNAFLAMQTYTTPQRQMAQSIHTPSTYMEGPLLAYLSRRKMEH